MAEAAQRRWTCAIPAPLSTSRATRLARGRARGREQEPVLRSVNIGRPWGLWRAYMQPSVVLGIGIQGRLLWRRRVGPGGVARSAVVVIVQRAPADPDATGAASSSRRRGRDEYAPATTRKSGRARQLQRRRARRVSSASGSTRWACMPSPGAGVYRSSDDECGPGVHACAGRRGSLTPNSDPSKPSSPLLAAIAWLARSGSATPRHRDRLRTTARDANEERRRALGVNMCGVRGRPSCGGWVVSTGGREQGKGRALPREKGVRR
jgi:hypothetical protein